MECGFIMMSDWEMGADPIAFTDQAAVIASARFHMTMYLFFPLLLFGDMGSEIWVRRYGFEMGCHLRRYGFGDMGSKWDAIAMVIESGAGERKGRSEMRSVVFPSGSEDQ
jgi:hypothetical protein